MGLILAFLLGGIIFTLAVVGWLYQANPDLKWKR